MTEFKLFTIYVHKYVRIILHCAIVEMKPFDMFTLYRKITGKIVSN